MPKIKELQTLEQLPRIFSGDIGIVICLLCLFRHLHFLIYFHTNLKKKKTISTKNIHIIYTISFKISKNIHIIYKISFKISKNIHIIYTISFKISNSV